MTPRQIALLLEAVRHDGIVDSVLIGDVDKLIEQGYVVNIGFYVCEITDKGREALRDAREW